jgi:hypothetical protein
VWKPWGLSPDGRFTVDLAEMQLADGAHDGQVVLRASPTLSAFTLAVNFSEPVVDRTVEVHAV